MKKIMKFSGRKVPNGNRIIFTDKIWTNQDILRFLKENNLPYSKAYGEIKEREDGTLYTTGETRTGCQGCLFGIHLEDPTNNRMQRMAKANPRLYDYYLNKLNLKQVLDYIGVPSTCKNN